MKKRYSIIFYRTKGLSNNKLEEIGAVIEENFYSEEKNFGYIDLNQNFNYLSAILLKRTPTYISEFDYQTRTIVKKQIFLFTSIRFAIDAEFNTIEIHSSIQNARKVFSALRKTLGSRILIEHVDFTPATIFPQLKDNAGHFRIISLKVNNFNIQNKIYGNFDIKSISTEFAYELIKKFKHDVKKATAVLDNNLFSKVEISFSENGQIQIKSDDDIDEIIYQVKSIIFI